MTDRSPTSAEDNLVLGRRTAAEIDAARHRVRAYLAERKNCPSMADSIDGAIDDDGVRLLASDVRIVLADLERARANNGSLRYRLRGEQHHHRNDVNRLTDQHAAETARLRRELWNSNFVVEQLERSAKRVDDALGPRYHKPTVHYSIFVLAERAAAELAKHDAEQARPARGFGPDGPDPVDLLDELRADLTLAIVESLGDGRSEADFDRAACAVLDGLGRLPPVTTLAAPARTGPSREHPLSPLRRVPPRPGRRTPASGPDPRNPPTRPGALTPWES